MGMRMFSCGGKESATPLPNPNPFKYEIRYGVEVGKNLMVLIHYPDCTTYGGNKLLVYKNINLEAFTERCKLWGCDPHFLENQLSPFARFVPDEDGLRLAQLVCLAK